MILPRATFILLLYVAVLKADGPTTSRASDILATLLCQYSIQLDDPPEKAFEYPFENIHLGT